MSRHHFTYDAKTETNTPERIMGTTGYMSWKRLCVLLKANGHEVMADENIKGINVYDHGIEIIVEKNSQ
ncbi:hypothetical protein [Rhizobium phage RHph_X2_28B]|uniref:hypothetical protein n=1 Tax=Rhizobium phage RHph_X2_28B TaxID=2836086 RepID=UPI0023297648|nr:hypothetical protein PP751_gp005 [Rhizobium phage RHph_X2_28B]QWY83457.1 hypothetical protein [Rhizobium phage RHph_X2_28B]QWY83693.1 hypothetical protein [Rhizobium phage RHph_X3_15]